MKKEPLRRKKTRANRRTRARQTQTYTTLCIAAYGFLISEREAIPPSRPRSTRLLPAVGLSEGYRPRSSPAAARAPHPELDRDDAPPLDCRTGHNAPAMSMLFSTDDKASAAEKFLMQ